ncbi:MAG TPA: CorA family divalent cation transporter, partial [Bacillota bacterium]|nr:CorA family divalent cation transporter [Bacillota bacterium]
MLTLIIREDGLEARETPELKLFEGPRTVNFATDQEELRTIVKLNQVHDYTLAECAQPSHHARLDCHSRYLYGILNTVDLMGDRIVSEAFNFYLTEFALVIVCQGNNHFIDKFIAKLSSRELIEQLEDLSPQKLFLSLYESLIENNDSKIDLLEDRLESLEERIMVNAGKAYLKEIIAARKLIMHLKHHLEPLQFFIQALADNENNVFTDKQLKSIRILSYKTVKMVENTTLL